MTPTIPPDNRPPQRFAAAGEGPRARFDASVPLHQRPHTQNQHPAPSSAPALQGVSAPSSSVCSPSGSNPQTRAGTSRLPKTPAKLAKLAKLDSTPRSANHRDRTSTRHAPAASPMSATLRHQVLLVCDRLLADLLALGYDLLNAHSIPALAHLLARWRGVAIVLLADGPDPETNLPDGMPFFALELVTGEVAIIYHASLPLDQQQHGILHLLAHFVLFWSVPTPCHGYHPTGTSGLYTCSFRAPLGSEPSSDGQIAAIPVLTVAQTQTWHHSELPTPQMLSEESPRFTSARCASPETDIDAAEAWERCASELTHRFQTILHR